jgi:hypothetical protein
MHRGIDFSDVPTDPTETFDSVGRLIPEGVTEFDYFLALIGARDALLDLLKGLLEEGGRENVLANVNSDLFEGYIRVLKEGSSADWELNSSGPNANDMIERKTLADSWVWFFENGHAVVEAEAAK